MGLPPQRSMNRDLVEGMTDGSRKKLAPNRGGFPEPTTPLSRRELNDRNFDMETAPAVVLPDGTTRTRGY